MKAELRFERMECRAADLGAESSVPDLAGEDIMQNRLSFDLSESDEIYEAYGQRENAYPYRQYNLYSRELHRKSMRTAVLENDNLKATFLIERGGRLWELYDKKKQRSLLYTNDVLRYSNLAVRNAWFSGGVEWNIGIIGHTPLTTAPLYVSQLTDSSGCPVLRMYEYERIRKVVYQMDFWLSDAADVLNCRMRIANESPDVIPMYWWSNIAVPEYENGRIIVPAEEAFTVTKNTVTKVAIPFIQGVDITDYTKIPASIDYFFDIPEASPKYIANIDRDGYGLLQLSTSRLQSRKLFSWGNNKASAHWQSFLTENAGRYLEIQAGLGKTQYGCLPMAPHTAWEWMEQYGAVQLPKEKLAAPHEARSAYMTHLIQEQKRSETLQKLLADTKKMAMAPSEMVSPGSSYGAMRTATKMTRHLEFCLDDANVKIWNDFFESGLFPAHSTDAAPDEFLIDADNLAFLKASIRANKANQKNWYAYYHLGIGCFITGSFSEALQAFNGSLQCENNAWACHGAALCQFKLGDSAAAVSSIINGLHMQNNDISYIKAAMGILQNCKAYSEICDVFQALNPALKENERLKFYYVCALEKLGKSEKAFQILNENGGLICADIREGNDETALLWSRLYQQLYGAEKEAPAQFLFKSYL